MRLLVVSNHYPPHFFGGYELGCRDIVNLLCQRGHEALVLTSTYRTPALPDQPDEPHVRRVLQLEGGEPAYHPGRYLREAANRRIFRAALASFQPDFVYFWNQAGLPGSLVRLTRAAGLPYVFYLSDQSFLDWWVDSFWRRWIYPESNRLFKALFKKSIKGGLRWLRLLEDEERRYYHPRQFTSSFLQRLCGAQPADSLDRVIPWGVDLSRFPYRATSEAKITRLLYVGQIEPHKGTLTAIQALACLKNDFGWSGLTLSIAGGSSSPDYLAELQALIQSKHLTENVRLLGRIDRRKLSSIYHEHDVLIFPSIWEEPFAITPLEAMSSGVVVVGTATGGSKEIFVHGRNSLVFAPGDAKDCARNLHTLLSDPALHRELRVQGRRLIEEKYSLDRMADSIEKHFEAIRTRPFAR